MKKNAFQFHYGSIGSLPLRPHQNRLIQISIPLWFDWKRQIKQRGNAFLVDFNSTMVRLEDGDNAGTNAMLKEFQFHYGSIGRTNTNKSFLRCLNISIPLWFDWKSSLIGLGSRSTTISIPLWFDWKKT